jgi:hypothetical protein
MTTTRRVLIFALAASSLALGACSSAPPSPTPAPVVEAPYPVEYTCAQQRQAGREFDALPPRAMLRLLVDDYGQERKALRALHNQADPPPCPPEPSS